MKLKLLYSLLLASLLATVSLSAHADTTFTYTGPDTLSFSIPDPAVPGQYNDFYNIALTLNGSPTVGLVEFGAQYFAIRLNGVDLYGYIFGADAPFAELGNPIVFLPGTYITEDYNDYHSNDAGSGTLILSSSSAATPEPSSLILLGTGTLGVFARLRRRD